MSTRKLNAKKTLAVLAVAAILDVLATAPASAVNIAGGPFGGVPVIGSIGTNVTGIGTGHSNAGALANLIDRNETTRVDNYSTSTAHDLTYAYMGIRWNSARPEVVRGTRLVMATFTDGGWFGTREGLQSGQPLTREHLSAPFLQIATNSGATVWMTVPAKVNYLSDFLGHVVATNEFPTKRAFTVELIEGRRGITGIRLVGRKGGHAGGMGFIGGFELEVEADVLTDTDADGMDDHWETANGLTVGMNDGGSDLDSDGLRNAREFYSRSNPNQADTDGDTLNDGAEANIHFTNPLTPDTDADGLSDNAELTTHGTDPSLQDTDGDGLEDGVEVCGALTSPTNRDSDGDGFSDGIEIQLGTNPLSSTSRAPNIARAGSPLLGFNLSTETNLNGIQRINPVMSGSVNDGNLVLRTDNVYSLNSSATHAHVGILWAAPWTHPVRSLEVFLAPQLSGGWFGPNLRAPGAGNPLLPTHLTPPVLQVTTNGVNWITVPSSNNYLVRFTGFRVGGGGYPKGSYRSFNVGFLTPAVGIRGVRLIGVQGGSVPNLRGYLGVWEVIVTDITTSTGVPATDDSDADGLTDAMEATAGTNPASVDTDEDGLSDGDERSLYASNPLNKDTDGDYFPDGWEAARVYNPVSASLSPRNIAIVGGGLIGTHTMLGTTLGTPAWQAGFPEDVTDGNIYSRVDNWNASTFAPYSFVGAQWPTNANVNVGSLRVIFATFNNGGWFGPPNVGPGGNGLLTAAHLEMPTVQITRDGGTTWSAVPHMSDYLTVLIGHRNGGAPNPSATPTPVATFTLNEIATNVSGVRLIGREGGHTQGFVGVFDLSVFPTAYVPPDSDGDQLPDAWEIEKTGDLAQLGTTTDSDADGYGAFREYLLHLDPNAFSPTPATSIVNGCVTTTLQKRPGLVYHMSSGSELTGWDRASARGVRETPTWMIIRDNMPTCSGASQRFLKVEVTPLP